MSAAVLRTDSRHGAERQERGASMEDVFGAADDLGPAKIIHVYEPALGLKAVLVVDNVACGPSIGGLRMASDVSTTECLRLARAMTLKNAAAGLPHGGGKSVLYGDPRTPPDAKERLIRAFAYALRNEGDYIFGPDMGTDETCMAWVKDEIGRAVGKHSARFLAERGAILVAASDSQGTIYDPNGIAVADLIGLKGAGEGVSAYTGGRRLDREAVLDIECDIWIPAARPDVVREDNVGRLKARLVVQGANIPFTAGAEQALHERGVLVIPDFIANAGGVICAAMEYRGATQAAAFAAIEEKIRANTSAVLDALRAHRVSPRRAGLDLATAQVKRAMSYRRFSIL